MKFIPSVIRRLMLNKTDVEILWTLKSFSKNLTRSEIVSNNDRLTFNDKFRLRLLYLKDNDFVEMQSIQDYGIHYGIKKKSIELIWSDTVRSNILNLIKIAQYTLDEILYFLDDSSEDVRKEIDLLQCCEYPMIKLVIINNEKKFQLTPAGENFISNYSH